MKPTLGFCSVFAYGIPIVHNVMGNRLFYTRLVFQGVPCLCLWASVMEKYSLVLVEYFNVTHLRMLICSINKCFSNKGFTNDVVSLKDKSNPVILMYI